MKQFEQNMQARFQQMANFAERNTAYSQKELLNYVKLTSRNNDMINALFYASLNPRMTVGAIIGEALVIHGLV